MRWWPAIVLPILFGIWVTGLGSIFAPMFPIPRHRHAAEWLLLLVPPSLICGIMVMVEVVPAGQWWFVLQLLLVSVFPLAAATGSAAFISDYLSDGSKIRRAAVSFVEGPVILFTWMGMAYLLGPGWS